jgi:hypothetical protein
MGIFGRRHCVRVADPAVTAVNHCLAPTGILKDLLRPLLGFALGFVVGACTFGSRLPHIPSTLAMRNDMTLLRHVILSFLDVEHVFAV